MFHVRQLILNSFQSAWPCIWNVNMFVTNDSLSAVLYPKRRPLVGGGYDDHDSIDKDEKDEDICNANYKSYTDDVGNDPMD